MFSRVDLHHERGRCNGRSYMAVFCISGELSVRTCEEIRERRNVKACVHIPGAPRIPPPLSLQTTPAMVFGLLGEGVLPPVDFAQSIAYVEEALAGCSTPTAVTTRSQAKADPALQWLPDTFIAQIWCNRLMMTRQIGFTGETVTTSALGSFLPKLITSHQSEAGGGRPVVVVDGTHLMPSVFDSEGGGYLLDPVVSNAVPADGEEWTRIGTLELALVRSESGTASIDTAPWPPQYVLEHVANDEGMVIVSSVNCGYLDFAINFLRAAQKVGGDVKVTVQY